MYNFSNKSDDQLDALADAVRHEQVNRCVAKIKAGKFPAYVYDETLSVPQNIINYRLDCKIAGVYVSLFEAHTMMKYLKGEFNA